MAADSLYTSFEDHVFDLVEYVQFFGYAVASLIALKKYRIRIKNLYLTVESLISLLTEFRAFRIYRMEITGDHRICFMECNSL